MSPPAKPPPPKPARRPREKFERSDHWVWRQREEQLLGLLETPATLSELHSRARLRYRWSLERVRQTVAFAEGRTVWERGGVWRRYR
jgi:hypothetical protein